MKSCKLIVRDAVNVRFEGLDVGLRKKMCDALKFKVPEARHMPLFKLGRWDGTVSFCSASGSTYLNVLDRLLPLLFAEKIDIEVVDRRPEYNFKLPAPDAMMFAHINWPSGHIRAGEPIILRDYQVTAIRLFIANLQGLQTISTAAGKTIITAALSHLIEPYGRSIIIVPSKSLVTQTEEDYRNIGLDVGVFYGDRKEWGHTHTICTWQSLAVFSKKSGRSGSERSIMDFLQGVICVIIDEVHSAKATILRNLLCGPCAHIPIRWGLTGTIPKAEHEAISLLASIGPVVGELRAATLQASGILAKCKIDIVQTNEDHVEFASYASEHDFLMTDPSRLTWMANFIANIAESGNTLVLVDRIETGDDLESRMLGSVFVSGTTKSSARKVEYDQVQTVNNKIIIATYGVASTGINIPRLFNCVLVQPGKSFVRVVQSIGRILRRTDDKSLATVIDITSTLKFSRKHLSKRCEYYREAEYPFKLTKLDYR